MKTSFLRLIKFFGNIRIYSSELWGVLEYNPSEVKCTCFQSFHSGIEVSTLKYSINYIDRLETRWTSKYNWRKEMLAGKSKIFMAYCLHKQWLLIPFQNRNFWLLYVFWIEETTLNSNIDCFAQVLFMQYARILYYKAINQNLNFFVEPKRCKRTFMHCYMR